MSVQGPLPIFKLAYLVLFVCFFAIEWWDSLCIWILIPYFKIANV